MGSWWGFGDKSGDVVEFHSVTIDSIPTCLSTELGFGDMDLAVQEKGIAQAQAWLHCLDS
jgi:hypothetical protein